MSSKRQVRRKQCAGKKKHPTEQAAIAAMVHTPSTGLVEAVKKYFKSERLEILKREARAVDDLHAHIPHPRRTPRSPPNDLRARQVAARYRHADHLPDGVGG